MKFAFFKTRRRRILAAGAAILLIAAVSTGVALAVKPASKPAARPLATSAPSATPSPAGPTEAPYTPLTSAQVSELPEAKYNSVIAGLIPYEQADPPQTVGPVYSLAADTPLYAADKVTPVARFAAKNFLGDNSIIVPVATVGAWTLVMTPARQQLPSKHVDGTPPVPAQTVAWMRTDALIPAYTPPDRIVISVGKQTLTIETVAGVTVQEFSVGVGAAGTPTPSQVTGYLQARYLDPSQGQSKYPIQLTSLHATAADEPYSGHDGGLIGVHYYPTNQGATSHGCVRLPAAAITAVNALQLGTLVSFVP